MEQMEYNLLFRWFVGLPPKKHQSGGMDIPGGITKAADGMVRPMLYKAAQAMLTLTRAQPGDRCRRAEAGRRAPSHVARRNDIPLRQGAAAAHYGTPCHVARRPWPSTSPTGSKGPLHLLVDNEALSAIGPRTMPNGIKVESEGEWHARKHGGAKRRVWRKIHLGIDEKTLEVPAVAITGRDIGDAPVLPDLPDQIPATQEIGSGEPCERRRPL